MLGEGVPHRVESVAKAERAQGESCAETLGSPALTTSLGSSGHKRFARTFGGSASEREVVLLTLEVVHLRDPLREVRRLLLQLSGLLRGELPRVRPKTPDELRGAVFVLQKP